MVNEEDQDNLPSNHPSNDPDNHWDKPIGKIILAVIGSVIAGTILVFIGFAINHYLLPKVSNQEPTIGIVIEKYEINKHVKFKLINESKVDVDNVKVFERFYASPFKNLSSQTALGPQAVLPTINIAHLKPQEKRNYESFAIFNPQPLITEINKGDRGGFLEFCISFRHGESGKQYSQVHKFLVLPSGTGWQFKEIYDDSFWALKQFIKAK